uniref:Uncharacterized protein n=1 Tax=Arundo donax TaxID=35708 RepID=A0A0A9FE43_ARUDO
MFFFILIQYKMRPMDSCIPDVQCMIKLRKDMEKITGYFSLRLNQLDVIGFTAYRRLIVLFSFLKV